MDVQMIIFFVLIAIWAVIVVLIAMKITQKYVPINDGQPPHPGTSD